MSQLEVLCFALVSAKGSLTGENEIVDIMAFEGVAVSGLIVPVVLKDRVLETSCFESDDRSSSYEELVLDDTTWLKNARHEAEVGAAIYKRTVGEELVGISPETTGVLVFKVPHFVGALSGVGLSHVDSATNQDIDFVPAFDDKLFCRVKNEVNTLLGRDSTHKGEQRN